MRRERCSTPRCQNQRRRDGRDCPKCNMRAWRASRPMRAAFATLRDHARERGIEFSISFECFEMFALQSDYIARKGLAGGSLTVDRIDNLRGYVPGNIQPMTRSENSVKRARHDLMRMERSFSGRAAV